MPATPICVAMPSSFAPVWFPRDPLADDMQMLVAAYNIANQNCLACAAGYADQSFPLDREMTTSLLWIRKPSLYSRWPHRCRAENERAAAMYYSSFIASTLGHLAGGVCMWMYCEFRLRLLPRRSLQMRSCAENANRPQRIQNEIAPLTANLSPGPNIDLQLLKDIIFPATTEMTGLP